MQQKSFSQNVHRHRFLRTRQFHPGGQGPLDPLFVHRHPEEVVLGRLDILVCDTPKYKFVGYRYTHTMFVFFPSRAFYTPTCTIFMPY